MSPEKRQELLIELGNYAGEQVDLKEKAIKLALMSDYTEEAIIRNKNWGKLQGLSTGYKSLDKLTLGLVGGEMIVVAGKTSNGKTTLSINIANRVALKGVPVLFVTLEMTHAEIASRYMRINGGDTDDYNKVASLTLFQANDELNWQSIDPLIERAVEEMKIGLVVIDHLHYFTRDLEHVAEDLGRISKELKKNANRYKIPVILISHVRKTGEGREATIEDLRSSSYIAQDADIVLMVGRSNEKPDHTNVKIEKNRNRGYDTEDNIATLKNKDIRLYDMSETVPYDPFEDKNANNNIRPNPSPKKQQTNWYEQEDGEAVYTIQS